MRLKNTLGMYMDSISDLTTQEEGIVSLDNFGMQVAGYYVRGYKSEHRSANPAAYGDYFGDTMLNRNGRGAAQWTGKTLYSTHSLDSLSKKNEYRNNEFSDNPGKFYFCLEETNHFMPGDFYTHPAFTNPDKQLGANYQTSLLLNAELWMPNGHEVVMSFKQKWADRNAGRCVTANGLRYMLTPVPDFVQGWL